MSSSNQPCPVTTKAGKPCTAPPTETGLCYFHEHPEKAAELGRKGGIRNRHYIPLDTVDIGPLNTAADVKDMLAKLVTGVAARTIDAKLAASIGSLVLALLKAIETPDLEARLALLEGVKNESEATD